MKIVQTNKNKWVNPRFQPLHSDCRSCGHAVELVQRGHVVLFVLNGTLSRIAPCPYLYGNPAGVLTALRVKRRA